MRRVIRIGACLLLALGMGCSSDDPTLTRQGGDPLPMGGSGGDASAGAPVPFCDALTVVRAKCQRCHGDPRANGAPVAFLKFEDFHAQYYDTQQQWWQVMIPTVSKGLMPYVALNDPPTSLMPPVESLSDDEKTTLLDWLNQGAQPEGGTDCP